jgi:hypothetical protein
MGAGVSHISHGAHDKPTIEGTAMERLEPHELRVALMPGLFPGVDNAPETVEHWTGLEDLREHHEAALEKYSRALDDLTREQRENPAQMNVAQRSEREAEARREVVAEVTRIVWEARNLLDDWRSVEDANKAERAEEIEMLRARLAELELEDLMLIRLQVWLKRLEVQSDTNINVGLHPWRQLAEPPGEDVRPVGPMTRSIQGGVA